ncbi:hypothetical protein [Ferruginibacter sp. HRS2-29]|uniref:hypothetical protein n=1 Tax=Ferruginibacter sp. HRS2-29 TaxID=2487334 RepID=UPI0020CCA30D|nr:hypothetical protein [Ferruginibacter sp. HRS2-29]MCP9753410.1 hypothetical protein [Ferruginibacter sp. HRS2-29]
MIPKAITQSEFDEFIDGLLRMTGETSRNRIDLVKIIAEFSDTKDLGWTKRQQGVFKERIYATKLFRRFFNEGLPALTDEIFLSDEGIKVLEEYDMYKQYRKQIEWKGRKKKWAGVFPHLFRRGRRILESGSYLITIILGIITISTLVIGSHELTQLNRRVKLLEDKANAVRVKQNPILDTPKVKPHPEPVKGTSQ